LVPSLSRPGGNLTGATTFAGALQTKRLELIHEVVPSATVIGMLINPDNLNAESDVRDVQAAADKLGVQLYVARAVTESEIEKEFAVLAQRGVGALLVNTDAVFTNRRHQLAALGLRHRLPTIYSNRSFAEAGGLMTYGNVGGTQGIYRQVGVYVGRVLKGEKPAELPVVQPTKFEFVFNLKTAKALGLTVPPTLLARADEVIE
jgi:putative ABC transport system substrate-binding protein